MTGRMAGLFPRLPMQGDNRAKILETGDPVPGRIACGIGLSVSAVAGAENQKDPPFFSLAEPIMALFPQQHFGKAKHLIIHPVQNSIPE